MKNYIDIQAGKLGRRALRMIRASIGQVVRAVASLGPVQKNLIMLEGNRSFDDNARSLFAEMLKRGLNKKYRIVWVLDNPDRFHELSEIDGVEVIKYATSWSPFSVFCDFLKLKALGSKAAWHIYTNVPVCSRWRPGQTSVYLTHGIPIKNVQGNLGRKADNFVCATSSFSSELIRRGVQCGRDAMIITGFPRNDDLLRGLPDDSDLLEEYQDRKKIIWMPTFKRLKRLNDSQDTRNDLKVDRDNDVSLMTPEFMGKLDSLLSECNATLMVKYHPMQDMSFVNTYDLENIKTLTQEALEAKCICFYQLLGEFDALITDYSSVSFDWLLLDRPIAYDVTDVDAYANGLGFMVDDPFEYMPGMKIKSEADFLTFVRAVCDGDDEWAEERRRVKDLMHDYQDAHSSERLLDALGI